MVADFQTKYSTSQLYDMLEILEVHDTLKQIAYDKAQNENKPRGGK